MQAKTEVAWHFAFAFFWRATEVAFVRPLASHCIWLAAVHMHWFSSLDHSCSHRFGLLSREGIWIFPSYSTDPPWATLGSIYIYIYIYRYTNCQSHCALITSCSPLAILCCILLSYPNPQDPTHRATIFLGDIEAAIAQLGEHKRRSPVRSRVSAFALCQHDASASHRVLRGRQG